MPQPPEPITIASPETSGRYLIFFEPGTIAETAKEVENRVGIKMMQDSEEAAFVTSSAGWNNSDTIVLPTLGVAICQASPGQFNHLKYGSGSIIQDVRQELIFSVAQDARHSITIGEDYLRGYQDGVTDTISRLMGASIETDAFSIQAGTSFFDTDEFTWGLQATGISQTQLTGRGVKVAVLDTGLDLTHPDFIARIIQGQSFVTGINTAQDDHGHGTHCAGTLCGPGQPSQGRRYGVAPEVDLFVGKVMKENGKGGEADILHGIEWAILMGCRIISLSLSKAVGRGELPLEKYEQIGRVALQKNCLLIAAAGNNSDRPGDIAPVTIPANSSSIMAVGAVNRKMTLYPNSNGGLNPKGGGIDLVGPGVEVYSSKLGGRWGPESGTSMATPHVAGIAALMMQADPAATAEQIWTRLTQSARRLSLPSIDVGSGLVQLI